MDRAARDAARWRLDRNVVVAAGAGTGKTALLTDRILFNLLGRPDILPITAVVALTFTEKAAGEIRLRLAEGLLELVACLSRGPLGERARVRAETLLGELRREFGAKDADVLERARAALEAMDQAQIGTIHSFAAHLLRLYPLQAGVDPGFRVDEGPGFEELFETEWSGWLDQELGESAGGERREDWVAALRWVPLADLADLARGLACERVDLSAAGRPNPEALRRLAGLAEQVREAARGQPQPRGNSRIREVLDGLSAHLAELAEAAADSRPPVSRPRRARLPQAVWPSGWDPAGRPAYESARRLAAGASAQSEALVRRVCHLLAPFAADLRRRYAQAGLVSFDGLLFKARDLVRDHPEVREELKARYEAFLVDEFQDTDPLQGELLMFLAEERGGRAARWERARPGPGRLFIVGDPKQSIYRFRGADMAAYQSFTAHLLAQGGAFSCDLETNFRSTAAVVGAVNAICPWIMRYKPGSQPAYAPIAAREPEAGKAGPAVELVVVGPAQDGAPDPDALSGQRAEASWLAGWIAAQCGGSGTRRFKDVAVLMRTGSALAPLLDAFKSAEIPYAVEMERLFYDSQEIIDFLNLLRVLDDPEDRISMAGLLRSPFLGLADDDLCRLARAGTLSYIEPLPAGLPKRERDRLRRLLDLLRSLRQRVGRCPLGELVEAILNETPFLPAAARAYHGQQTVSNLLKLARMAAAAADERGATLREFIGLVARAREEDRAEGESPLADEHLDAVRILSIHKAKGLEFPVVCVYNLSGASGRGAAQQAVLADWQTGRCGLRLARCGLSDVTRVWLEETERERQQDEAVRLLYVALTRAREKLILTGRQKADQGTLAHLLSEAGAWPLPEQDALQLQGAGPILVHRIVAGQESRAGAGGAGVLRPKQPLPPEPDLARVWRARLRRRDESAAKRWTRSPTDYLREREKGFDWEEAHSGLDAAPMSGALIGQVCHKVLACWDFKRAGDCAEAVAEACRTLAAAAPDADWVAVRRDCESVLSVFLGSPAARELGEAEILGRELPFVFGEEGTVVRGTIDLLYRQGGRVVVADYKSEAVTPEKLGELGEKYRRQGADYRAAVERAWGFDGVRFRLIFLRRPDLVWED